jgi:sulfite reductase beta subunit-like hemoprotein
VSPLGSLELEVSQSALAKVNTLKLNTLLAPLHEQLLRNINGCTGRDYTCSGALTVSKQYVYAGREQYCLKKIKFFKVLLMKL